MNLNEMDDSEIDLNDKNLNIKVANINITNEIKESEKIDTIGTNITERDKNDNKLKPNNFKSYAFGELISKDMVNDIVGNVFHEIVKKNTNLELPEFSYDFSIKMINNLIKSNNIFYDSNEKSSMSKNNSCEKNNFDENDKKFNFNDVYSWEFEEKVSPKNKWNYLENPKSSILDFYSSSNIKILKVGNLKKRMSQIIRNNTDNTIQEDSNIDQSENKNIATSRNIKKDNSSNNNVIVSTFNNNNINNINNKDNEKTTTDNIRISYTKKLTVNKSTFNNNSCVIYQADESIKTIEEDDQIVKIRNQKMKELKLKEEEEKRREAIQQKLKKQAEIELMVRNRQFDSNKLALNFMGEPININKVIMTEINDYKIPKFIFKDQKKDKNINSLSESEDPKLKNKISNKISNEKIKLKIKIKTEKQTSNKDGKKDKNSKPNTKSINITKNSEKSKSSKRLIVVNDNTNNLVLGGNNFE